eukprot:TRINITY_DN4886_c0_g2_i1.p1 TRINITY_DN4886_c0_g2~~TRINITY_DN4886_c0_g2_i1.p1  ORF type:complete len:607 (+),score=115.55 TRINITY_DN4886_c0_g2_i1:52-1872(+)
MEISFGPTVKYETSSCLINTGSLTILCNAGTSLRQLIPFSPFKKGASKEVVIEVSLPAKCPVAAIDVVLVSNYRDLLGLPCLYKQGFKGRAFATCPVLLLGKPIVLSLIGKVRKEPIKPFNEVGSNIKLYTQDEAIKAMSKVTSVNYKEIIHLSKAVKIRATSSGYELGSCNWDIFIGDTKVTFISLSSNIRYRYPQQIYLEQTTAKDVLIVAQGVLRDNSMSCESFDKQFALLWDTINGSLAAHPLESVVMPISILQMLDMLDMFLCKVNRNAGIFLFSDTIEALIGYSSYCSEYLSESLKQKLLAGVEAFSFNKLIKESHFRYYSDITHMQKVQEGNYKSIGTLANKIFLVTHSSLRLGEGYKILHSLVLQRPETLSVILTDPNFACKETLSNFFDKAKTPPKVFFVPLDYRLTKEDLHALFSRYEGRNIVCPEEYGILAPKGAHKYKEESVITIPIDEVLVGVNIDSRLYLGLQEQLRAKIVMSNNELALAKPEQKDGIKNLLAGRLVRRMIKRYAPEAKSDVNKQWNKLLVDIKLNGLELILDEKDGAEVLSNGQSARIRRKGDRVLIECDFKELREALVRLYIPMYSALICLLYTSDAADE